MVLINIEVLCQLDLRLPALYSGYSHPYGTKSIPASFYDPTYTVNAGLRFQRGRFVIVFALLAASCRDCAENPFIQSVQFPRATSF